MPALDASQLVRREIAGVPIADLVRDHGTPLYVYDAELIRRRCQDLAAWDTIRFAQKACSNLAVLDLVRREGVLVDAVSSGEIHRALAAGYPAHAEAGTATPPTSSTARASTPSPGSESTSTAARPTCSSNSPSGCPGRASRSG